MTADWRTLPREPTPEMLSAALDWYYTAPLPKDGTDDPQDLRTLWQAMFDAFRAVSD